MVWFKVDDGFYSHPKTIQIPRSGGLRALAAGTWVLCGTWSSDHKLDGKIPLYAIDEAGGTIEGAEELVRVKLWRKRRDGYQFHNWDEFQPTRAAQEEAAEKERVRKANYRARLNASDSAGESGNVPAGQTRNPALPSRPVPTRTEPMKNPSSIDNQTAVIHSVDEGVSNPLFEKIIATAAAGGLTIHPLVVPDIIAFIDGRRGPRAKPIQAPERYYPGVVRDEFPVVSQFIHEKGLAS